MMQYKITIKQQILLLLQPVFIYIVLISVAFYKDVNISDSLCIICGIAFLFDTWPVIILHIQYWIINNNSTFTINEQERTISYFSKNKNIEASFDDVKVLEYNVSYGRNTEIYSSAAYRYFKIVFKDNSHIIITSLLMNDIENTLPGLLRIEMEKKFHLICFCRYE